MTNIYDVYVSLAYLLMFVSFSALCALYVQHARNEYLGRLTKLEERYEDLLLSSKTMRDEYTQTAKKLDNVIESRM